MNWARYEGNWKLASKIRQQRAKLTGDDLHAVDSQHDQSVGRIRERNANGETERLVRNDSKLDGRTGRHQGATR